MSDDLILLDHGSGGKASHRLIAEYLAPAFKNPILDSMGDGAILDINGCRLAYSTDTFVVDPIFFPGGDIGDLAVNGTVNDVAMCGATPLFISVGLILEEGFAFCDLKKIVASMKKAADKAGVKVVTGDTKVVPKGKVDKIFINTSGIGVLGSGVDIGPHKIKSGDSVILSGTMGDHGVAVLAHREGIDFQSTIKSDTVSLAGMVKSLMDKVTVSALRDPTRGGVGTTLCEIAEESNLGIKLMETSLPIDTQVKAACDFLGLDPMYVANEGKLLCFVAEEFEEMALATLRQNSNGKNAAVIGRVINENPGRVVMETAIGGLRIVDMLTGEQLPRIC